MAWDPSVPDWPTRIRAGQSLMPALPHLDQGHAKQAIAIFNKLRLPDVPVPQHSLKPEGVVP